jgi:hypothetical protein
MVISEGVRQDQLCLVAQYVAPLSDSHDEKHSESKLSTFPGIMIHTNDENENVLDSIRFNQESDPNEIE